MGNNVEVERNDFPNYGCMTAIHACRFDQCSISPLSLKGIKDAGYEKMTVVQEATLPLILKGSFLFRRCLGIIIASLM